MTEKAKRKVMIATYHTHVLFSALFKIVLVLFAAWFGFSLVEVWIHNASMLSAQPYEYSPFNLFEVLMNL